MRVVIVDDDERLLSAMQECFIGAGDEVVTFAQFEPAKSYLATAEIDALVTDVRLGAYNGLQLVMLAKWGHPEMKAMVLSGFEDPVLRHDAANIGASFCLKPVDREQLLHGIHGAASQSV